MNILGLDTSTPVSAVAVLRADGATFDGVPDSDALLGPPGHSRDLLPAAAAVLDEAGLRWSDLDVVAVGTGPGAFTGLRIGVATARALAAAHGIELRAVSSLHALAEGIDAPVRLPLIDARRGEVFGALYAGEREIWPPFAATPSVLIERLAQATEVPLAAGNGSVRFRQVLEDGGVRVSPPGAGVHLVSALAVCGLARSAPPASLEEVLPNYLREPDAQPQ